MPGASDAYVTGFRSWLQQFGGGGPFGPQNEAWLLKAGPRLSNDQLLDHYHSHTEKCSTCRTALPRMQALRLLSVVGAAVSGLAALACAGVWWAVTQLPSFSTMVPAAGEAGGGGWWSLGWGLVGLGREGAGLAFQGWINCVGLFSQHMPAQRSSICACNVPSIGCTACVPGLFSA